ncbi:MAG: HAD family hydrolase, partial [Halobacteriaceae archaeon]
MTVNTILFDLDNTLCEYNRSPSDLLSESFARLGIDPFFDEVEYINRYEEFLDDADSMEELRKMCFSSIAESKGRDPGVGYELADIYNELRDYRNVRYTPGAEQILERVTNTHQVGILTNGDPEMQWPKINALGLDEYYDDLVFAGHSVPAKPDPDPFQHILSNLDSTPNQAVHIGDNLDTDIAGAKAVGCHAVWVEDPSITTPSPTPDYSISQLN